MRGGKMYEVARALRGDGSLADECVVAGMHGGTRAAPLRKSRLRMEWHARRGEGMWLERSRRLVPQ